MCDKERIDATNNNTAGVTQSVAEVLDDGAGTVYFVWSEANAAGDTHNRKIKIRSYVPATDTFGTEHTIDTMTGADLNDVDTSALGAVRLSDGRICVAYGLFGVQSRESTDGGATWSARVNIDGAPGLVSTRSFCSIGTDGTNVWVVTQERSAGAGFDDVFLFKRTGAITYDAGRKIHDAKTSGAYPLFLPISSIRQLILTDANTGCWIHDYTGGAGDEQIRCLWTTDGWTTTHETMVKGYTNTYQRAPKMRIGGDGRIRALWIDDQGTGTEHPVLAYSDDVGQTWTLIGTPVILDGAYAWDSVGNRAFALSSEDGWFLSSLDNESEAGAYYHRLFTGGDALTGWTLTSCALVFTSWSGGGADEGFISGSKYIRCFNFSTGTEYQVNFLTEDVPTNPGGPPPLVEESPSGSDATNIVLRNRLSTKRGWSAHDWPFSCFAGWPEGDYTTQRRLPTKIAGVSVIDPSVDDPAALPALFAFDVPEHYGRERFMHAEDGTIVPRLDPFYRQAHTKAFAITNGVGVAIVRGVFVRYRRAGAPLSVQVWIDGVLIQTYSLPITGAAGGPDDIFPIKEVFLPVPRITNVGSFCQFRFEDESLYPFAIERVAIKKIDKVQRARNQGL